MVDGCETQPSKVAILSGIPTSGLYRSGKHKLLIALVVQVHLDKPDGSVAKDVSDLS